MFQHLSALDDRGVPFVDYDTEFETHKVSEIAVSISCICMIVPSLYNKNFNVLQEAFNHQILKLIKS